MALGLGEYITVSQLHRPLIRGRRGVLYHNFIDRQLVGRNVYSCTVKLFIKEPVTFEFRGLSYSYIAHGTFIEKQLTCFLAGSYFQSKTVVTRFHSRDFVL